MARSKKKVSTVYVVSVGAHLLVGAVLALVPQDKLREVVAIALNEAPKNEKKAEPPKPTPHTADRPAHAPGHAARNTAPVAAAAVGPQDMAGFQDIGLALDSSSEGGIAVNIAPQIAAAPVAAAPPPKPKLLVARPLENTCTEDVVKARPISMAHPLYTDSARRAHVEGRVRLELVIDERGEVASVRILQGLGYGLDEAAVSAAQHLHFTPATRCKKPVSAPFVLALRFVAGT